MTINLGDSVKIWFDTEAHLREVSKITHECTHVNGIVLAKYEVDANPITYIGGTFSFSSGSVPPQWMVNVGSFCGPQVLAFQEYDANLLKTDKVYSCVPNIDIYLNNPVVWAREPFIDTSPNTQRLTLPRHYPCKNCGDFSYMGGPNQPDGVSMICYPCKDNPYRPKSLKPVIYQEILGKELFNALVASVKKN